MYVFINLSSKLHTFCDSSDSSSRIISLFRIAMNVSKTHTKNNLFTSNRFNTNTLLHTVHSIRDFMFLLWKFKHRLASLLRGVLPGSCFETLASLLLTFVYSFSVSTTMCPPRPRLSNFMNHDWLNTCFPSTFMPALILVFFSILVHEVWMYIVFNRVQPCGQRRVFDNCGCVQLA